MEQSIIMNGKTIKISHDAAVDEEIFRGQKAVEAAIHKAVICKKPIARYSKTNGAYLEYPDGRKEYYGNEP